MLMNEHCDILDEFDAIIDEYAYDSMEREDDIDFEFTQQDIDESYVRIPTPKSGYSENLIPIVLVGVVTINGVHTTRPFVGLCDS